METLEQTEELEKAIKIKNEAYALYNDFNKYFTLKVNEFKDGRFRVWSDSHNSTYIKPSDNGFIFQARFLHESYEVLITPASLFSLIKNKYRGVDHFSSAVEIAKRNFK